MPSALGLALFPMAAGGILHWPDW